MEYTVIEGPRTTLNLDGHGPFAFTKAGSIDQYEATRWLYEYAKDNVEEHGGSWDQWSGWMHIADVYTIILKDENGNRQERSLTEAEISKRGVDLLEAACDGEDAYDIEQRFNKWLIDLEEDII